MGIAAFMAGVGVIATGRYHLRVAPRTSRTPARPGRTTRPCWASPPRGGADRGADVRLVAGDVAPVHAEMVAAAGGRDVWVVGGGDLAAQFGTAGLLDDVVLSIAPVTLGAGWPLFPRPFTCASRPAPQRRLPLRALRRGGAARRLTPGSVAAAPRPTSSSRATAPRTTSCCCPTPTAACELTADPAVAAAVRPSGRASAATACSGWCAPPTPAEAARAGRDEADWFMDYRNSDGSLQRRCAATASACSGATWSTPAWSPGPRSSPIATRDGVKVLTVGTATRSPSTWARPRCCGGTEVAVGRRRTWAAVHVDMGNPHAVAFVDDLAEAGHAARGARARPGGVPRRRQRRVRRAPRRAARRDAGPRARLGRDPLVRHRRLRGDGGRGPGRRRASAPAGRRLPRRRARRHPHRHLDRRRPGADDRPRGRARGSPRSSRRPRPSSLSQTAGLDLAGDES